MVRILDQVLKYLLILTVGTLTVSVFLQVIVRFVVRAPLPWTEEVARIAFVYSIFLGATLGVRMKAHIAVDVLLVIVPPWARFLLKMLSTLLVAIFLLVVTWQGAEFVRITGVQMTPVLMFPFRWLYIVIPVSSAIMLFYLVLNAVEEVRGLRAP